MIECVPWEDLTREQQIAELEAMEAAGFPFDVYPGGPCHPDAPPIIVEMFDAAGNLVERGVDRPRYRGSESDHD